MCRVESAEASKLPRVRGNVEMTNMAREHTNEHVVSKDTIEDMWADQVTTSCLLPGGRFLQMLHLTDCFNRRVVPPKDVPGYIKLQVPHTRHFMREQRAKGHPARKTNQVTTSKYNVWTFIPLAAGIQFRRFTNAFYLVILILALLGTFGNNLWIVSFSPITLVILIVFVVAVALVFEGKDDLERHYGDSIENSKVTHRVRGTQIEETTWGELIPGDMVFVDDRNSVPADLLLLAAFGADKKGLTCYVETSGIDGETNLKIKEVPAFMVNAVNADEGLKTLVSSARQSSSKLRREQSMTGCIAESKERMARSVTFIAAGEFHYEEPNAFLQFNASFTARNSTEPQPLVFKNLVLRGSQLRNTKWILGMVAYAGTETKLALSRQPTPAKLGLIDVFMNRILLLVAIFYVIMILIADIVMFTVVPDTDNWWYFKNTSSTNSFKVPGPVAYFFTYSILFSNFIPVPIIICIEVCNFYAKTVFEWDLEMYHKETNTRARCQTSNLVADIGQITHIFSDKTGTLTRNQMNMVGCFVKGKMHGFIPPEVIVEEIMEEDAVIDSGGKNGVAQSGYGNIYPSLPESNGAAAVEGKLNFAPADGKGKNRKGIAGGDDAWTSHTPGPPGSLTSSHERDGSGDNTEHVISMFPSSYKENGTTPMNGNKNAISDIELGRVDVGLDAVDLENSNNPQNDNDNDRSSMSSMKSLQVSELFADTIALLANENPAPEQVAEQEALFNYFLLLAVCHTVVIDFNSDGSPNFNSESPDEDAFVRCATILGIELESTSEGIVTVKIPGGTQRKFKVLGLNPFNSTRKRMSLIVQSVETNKIFMMMKGADNVMLDRIEVQDTLEAEQEIKEVMNTLEQYSWAGLRTLVMAQREVPEDEFLEWDKKRKTALLGPASERGKLLVDCAADMEQRAILLGVSAVEDQLQLGVPEAVQTLRDSGAQVWVLTGDKIETAINIGLSSNLLDSSMLQLKLISNEQDHLERQLDKIIMILDHAGEEAITNNIEAREEQKLRNGSFSCNRPTVPEQEPPLCMMRAASLGIDVDELQQNIDAESIGSTGDGVGTLYDRVWNKVWDTLLYHRCEDVQANVALIISGMSLEVLLKAQKGTPELEHKLLRVARICKVVLACRVSPAQKSQIVEMVRYAPDNKKRKTPVTLAIGDGANDVPMIQSAHVGVGINGNEGRQAANTSDFAIAQFRFLTRMLLVHGRWNYRRQAAVINFVIYSWVLYSLLLYIYLMFSLWSGQQVYYSTAYISVFAYWVNVGICTAGWINRDIGAENAMRNPWTYAIGVNSVDLNFRKVFSNGIRAIAHLFLIWGLVVYTSNTGTTSDTLGTAVYLAVVLVLIMRSSLLVDTWTSVNVLVYFLVLLVFFIFMGVVVPTPTIYSPRIGSNVWTGVILTVMTVTMLELFVKYSQKEFAPSPLDILVEIDRGYYKGSKHARASTRDALMVLEEFSKLTVAPLTIGARNIKGAINKRHHHDGLDVYSSMSSTVDESDSKRERYSNNTAPMTGQKSKRDSMFSNIRPVFDVDFPSIGSHVRKLGDSLVHKALRRRCRRDSEENVTNQMSTDEAEAHIMVSAANRIDMQNFQPGYSLNEPLNVLQETADNVNDDKEVGDEEVHKNHTHTDERGTPEI